MVRYILDNGNRKASSGDEDLVFTVMKNMLVQFCQAVAELHPSIRLFVFFYLSSRWDQLTAL